MTDYQDISEVFNLLNQQGAEYLVLRNYDNLLLPEMYQDGHGDIDMLCADSQQVMRIIQAGTDRKDEPPFRGDGTHYCIYVRGKYVSLDLRHVGDDYYCEQWEKDLLRRRIRRDCFYVMADEDYFYTLVYHAILQKRTFSEEYRQRLSAMAQRLGIGMKRFEESDFLRVLETYMREKGYVFRYSKDRLVPMRFSLVDPSMVSVDRKARWAHKRFEWKIRMIDFLVRVKHFMHV